jgi:dihydroorotate dehydrogenase electron transfer subunit
MEKVMACSIGVCRGCVIKLLKNNEETQASVCKDGPVFIGNEIIWD